MLASGSSAARAHRWLLGRTTLLATLHHGARAGARVGEHRREARDRDPALTVPSELSRPSSVSGTSLLVFGTSSIAANFSGSLL